MCQYILVAMDSFEMSTYRLSSDCSSSELHGYAWQGYKDSNLGMPESKSGALDQLGDTPIYILQDERNPHLGINNIMKCLHCQTNLFLKHQKKFCSRSCSASYNNKGVRRHSNPESKHSMVKPCKTCGKETSRPVYCSDLCNPKRLNLTPEQKLQRRRAMHNEAWHRYQARIKNQTPENVDVEALQQIYLNRPVGHEVDHIHPVSKGGLHSPENLQYLPKQQNRKKSNKLNWRPGSDSNAHHAVLETAVLPVGTTES